MKGSRLASMIGYKEAMMWNRKRLEACTDLFICPSEFMAQKMAQGGFNKNKLKTLCNFIDVEKCKLENYANRKDYYCFVGRLSHEKGVSTLIEAASKLPYPLKVIGGGPLSEAMKEKSKSLKANIEFMGFKQWKEIKEIVSKARFTVIPSEWYENNPLSVIEAQCLGTPVLGARIGGIPELIEENVTGMTFESGNVTDLRERIEVMLKTNFDYKNIALSSQNRYRAESYYDNIIKLYNETNK